MNNLLPILATLAGIIMSLGYFPQAYRMFKRKSVKDISLTTYLIFLPAIIIWLVYGLSIKDTPLITANILAFIGCSSVLMAYLKYHK